MNPGVVPMPRVLVVDDQKDVRAMVAIVLRVNRYDVVEAESGAAGLKALARALLTPRLSIFS
jgi:CheY-like chemotaxis protein